MNGLLRPLGVVKRIARASMGRGPRELIQLGAINLKYAAQSFSPAELRAKREEARFDRQFGIKTRRVREMGDLDVPIGLARHGVRYQPSDVDCVTEMIGSLDIDFSRFVFVDYGSGKGRVLCLASNYPFQRILGVEFSLELHQIAKTNIASYNNPAQRCTQVSSVCGNASHFVPPEYPLVCYFYNPFSETILQQVVANLERSIKENPRPIYILYLDPKYARLFEHSNFWGALVAEGDRAIYVRRNKEYLESVGTRMRHDEVNVA